MNDNQTINVTAQLDTTEIKNSLNQLEVSIKPIKLSVEVDQKGVSSVQTLINSLKNLNGVGKETQQTLGILSTKYQLFTTSATKVVTSINNISTAMSAFEKIGNKIYARFPQAA
ncbi:hypothetical protein [Fumia xinanensis]|uniref:Uncharacterized protein n=1 Tax=Fumia xinanensis TaxID=2763659 RepID=A0A926E3A4_9FIRM|nr:hypothetical protein [Fumia xinanensis]MBC8558725.1 hypothetical protein [Fumia xinanensis]